VPKPQSGQSDLERTPDGFHRTRLRYGKGLRGRFLIKLTDEAAAEKRATKMRELAELLARAGHSARAPIILEEAGAAPTEKDFDDAVRIAEALCAGKGKGSKKPRSAEPTFRDLADRWTDGRLAREYPDHVGTKKTADHDEARVDVICSVQLAPGLTFGALPLSAVTLDHAQAVMANLPERARRPATRRQYAQVLHRVLELAVFPCRYLTASPLPRGFMPKIGKPPAFPYLYPDEDAALLAWTAERAAAAGVTAERPGIPLVRRLLWGFLAREGCRTSEALGLRVGMDVDLARGVVRLDENKTDEPRAWMLDAGVAAALRGFVAHRDAKPGDLLFAPDPGDELESDGLAEQLRADLLAAGVTRTELHVDGKNTRKLRAHDLRGTFVTLSLANGRTETWVADRTGHASSLMINRYRKAARTAEELGLGPLHSLDVALPELPQQSEGGPKGGPERRRMPLARRARRSRIQQESSFVAPPGLEPGRTFVPGILNPPRLPFRQGAI
jgi:integrase